MPLPERKKKQEKYQNQNQTNQIKTKHILRAVVTIYLINVYTTSLFGLSRVKKLL